MINILVCDDDREFLSRTVQFIDSILSASEYVDLDYRIRETSDPEKLRYLATCDPPDILVLDIHMPGTDGLEIAESFSSANARTKIIFLSGYEELVFYSLRFSPFRFVRKSAAREELPEAINSAVKLIQNDSTNLVVRHYADVQYVPLSSIRYIEKIKNKNAVSVVCHTERFTHGETIQSLEARLSTQGFIRINTGILVNLKYVRRISGYDLYIGDEVLRISESRSEKVRHALALYMRSYGLS